MRRLFALTIAILHGAAALQAQRARAPTTVLKVAADWTPDMLLAGRPKMSLHAAADSTSSDLSSPEVDLESLSAESAAQTEFKPSIDLSDMLVKGPRMAPRQAGWLPMLLSPEALDGTMAGDVGFDPFGFARTKADLARYREAEIKHSRLAMLAAAGW